MSPGSSFEEEPPEAKAAESQVPGVRPAGSLEELCEKWPDILTEFSKTQPVQAGFFFDTELRPENRPAPSLTIVFRKENTYQFVKNKHASLKAVAAFLRTKFNNSTNFELKIMLLENSHERNTKEKPLVKKPATTLRLGEDELVAREPVIGYILEKFDGKLMT